MAESVYKIIEIVGTSSTSWEKAAAAAVERASQTLRDLRVARGVRAGRDHLRRQGRVLPRPAQDLVQVRGLMRGAGAGVRPLALSVSKKRNGRGEGSDPLFA